MDKVLALMRPFMKKELMDVMHLHTTVDSFVDKHLGRKFLPNEYGGEAGSIKDIQGEKSRFHNYYYRKIIKHSFCDLDLL